MGRLKIKQTQRWSYAKTERHAIETGISVVFFDAGTKIQTRSNVVLADEATDARGAIEIQRRHSDYQRFFCEKGGVAEGAWTALIA
jgi:hypothetical protein